jgi:hypothetical protein
MTYFTVLHWLALAIILILFILFLILTVRNHDGKSSLLPPILTNILAMSILGFFTFFILDKYTKVAELENIVQKKILVNESFAISGQVRNIGNFQIGRCSLEVKVSNGAIEKTGTDSAIFVPKSVFDTLFKRSSDDIVVETTKTFTIAENLHAGEMRNFTVFMRYPPSFSKPYTRYELSCH